MKYLQLPSQWSGAPASGLARDPWEDLSAPYPSQNHPGIFPLLGGATQEAGSRDAWEKGKISLLHLSEKYLVYVKYVHVHVYLDVVCPDRLDSWLKENILGSLHAKKDNFRESLQPFYVHRFHNKGSYISKRKLQFALGKLCPKYDYI